MKIEFYHTFKIPEKGINITGQWDLNPTLEHFKFDVKGKTLLDVACRDGFYSYHFGETGSEALRRRHRRPTTAFHTGSDPAEVPAPERIHDQRPARNPLTSHRRRSATWMIRPSLKQIHHARDFISWRTAGRRPGSGGPVTSEVYRDRQPSSGPLIQERYSP